ncbi:MAG: tandem-95 repeat protein [Proteobacteria bacterium]|nr:tandem-95 repeat protein [Pseudomonadota bacterium]
MTIRPPVAKPDSGTMAANGNYINMVPLANDTDPYGYTLTLVSVNTTGTKGQVIVNSSTNTLTYEPHQVYAYLSAGETATDTFTYTISDGHGLTSTATEAIIITGVNTPPVASTASATVGAYSTVAVNALASVTDINRDDTRTITALNMTGAKGTATIDPATGMIDYNPKGAFDYLSVGQTAIDSFQYTVADNHGGTSTGWVSVTVSGVNVAPVATNQTGSVAAKSSVWLNVAPFDTDVNRADTLSIVSISLTGTKGTGWLNPTANNGFNYAPNGAFNYLSAGETATDTLHYTVSDNHGATSTGVMTITVSGVNVAPVAAKASGSTLANQSVTFNVLANATDVNRDDVLTVSSVNTAGTDGKVTINGNGTITYTPQGADAALNFGQSATDSFQYTISDGHGGTSTATVSVLISGPPPNISDLLGSGYLSTKGSQFINAAGQVVRIVSVGWAGGEGTAFAPQGLNMINYQQTMQEMLQAGFNTIRMPWSDRLLNSSPASGAINYTLNPDLQGLTSIQVLQKIVAYAGQVGLKIIFDHHNNEASGGAQGNGLWYDLGGASNGTDGDGNVGTVTQATFQNNWVSFAKLWAGNSTVIGFDLANEPAAGTWLGPSTTSLQTMATQVGNAIQAVDPGALIIVEGGYSAAGPEGDLTGVAANPVVLNTANKVVYSVHEYPLSVNVNIYASQNPSQYIQQMNNDWGYLITRNIAPVWIGELGSNLATASDQLWAQTLMNYMNGYYAAEGGPSVTATAQGVSGDYWAWAYGTGAPEGMLLSNWKDIRQDQFALVEQMYPVQPASATSTATVSNSLVLYMQQDYYQGSAQFTVSVDGVQIGGLQTVNANATRANGQVQAFYYSGNFSAGTHTVTVTYANDRYGGPGMDRNLFINGITFDGATQTVVNSKLYSSGTLTNTIQATGTVTTTTVPDSLIIQASDTALGSSFVVYVDGVQVGGIQTLTALATNGQTQTFSLYANLGGGSHQVDIHQLSSTTDSSTINVSAIDYDGTLQSTTQTNANGTLDRLYTVAGGSVLNAGTINLGADTASAVITQSNQMVFLAAGTHNIEADASGFTLKVAGGSATISNFNPSADHVDLIGGIGGFVLTSQAAAAVKSDGAGGALLTMGSTTLDFVKVAPTSFTSSTFLLS